MLKNNKKDGAGKEIIEKDSGRRIFVYIISRATEELAKIHITRDRLSHFHSYSFAILQFKLEQVFFIFFNNGNSSGKDGASTSGEHRA